MEEMLAAIKVARESQNAHEFGEACEIMRQHASQVDAALLGEAVGFRLKLGVGILCTSTTTTSSGGKKPSKNLGEHERNAIDFAVKLLRLAGSCGRETARAIWSACRDLNLVPCLLLRPSADSSVSNAETASFQEMAFNRCRACPSLRVAAVDLLGAAISVGDSLLDSSPLHKKLLQPFDAECMRVLAKAVFDEDDDVCAAALRHISSSVPCDEVLSFFLSPAEGPVAGRLVAASTASRWERLPLPLMLRAGSAAGVCKVIRALAQHRSGELEGHGRAAVALACQTMRSLDAALSVAAVLTDDAADGLSEALIHLAAVFDQRKVPSNNAIPQHVANSLMLVWQNPNWASVRFAESVRIVSEHPSHTIARQAIARFLTQGDSYHGNVSGAVVADALTRYLQHCEHHVVVSDGRLLIGTEVSEVSSCAARLLSRASDAIGGNEARRFIRRVQKVADHAQSGEAYSQYRSTAGASVWFIVAAAFAHTFSTEGASTTSSDRVGSDVLVLELAEAVLAGARRGIKDESSDWTRNVLARCPPECQEFLDSALKAVANKVFSQPAERSAEIQQRVRVVALAARECGLLLSLDSTLVAAVKNFALEAEFVALRLQRGGEKGFVALARLCELSEEFARWRQVSLQVRSEAIAQIVDCSSIYFAQVTIHNIKKYTPPNTLKEKEKKGRLLDFSSSWCSTTRPQQSSWITAGGLRVVEDVIFLHIERSYLLCVAGQRPLNIRIELQTPTDVANDCMIFDTLVPETSATELLIASFAGREASSCPCISFARRCGGRGVKEGQLVLRAPLTIPSQGYPDDGIVVCCVVYRRALNSITGSGAGIEALPQILLRQVHID